DVDRRSRHRHRIPAQKQIRLPPRMQPQYRRLDQIRLTRRDLIAGESDRDFGHTGSPELAPLHQQLASFEERPGFAVTLLRMRDVVDSIKELPHPEGPRSRRLEGRTLLIQP